MVLVWYIWSTTCCPLFKDSPSPAEVSYCLCSSLFTYLTILYQFSLMFIDFHSLYLSVSNFGYLLSLQLRRKFTYIVGVVYRHCLLFTYYHYLWLLPLSFFVFDSIHLCNFLTFPVLSSSPSTILLVHLSSQTVLFAHHLHQLTSLFATWCLH